MVVDSKTLYKGGKPETKPKPKRKPSLDPEFLAADNLGDEDLEENPTVGQVYLGFDGSVTQGINPSNNPISNQHLSLKLPIKKNYSMAEEPDATSLTGTPVNRTGDADGTEDQRTKRQLRPSKSELVTVDEND